MHPHTLIVKSRFHHQITVLAVDRKDARSALTVRTTAGSDDAGRQLHRPFHRLFHFAEAAAALTRGDHRSEIRRLLARDMANCIERINSQIQQSASTSKGLGKSPCTRSLLSEEAAVERLQLAKLARLDYPDRLLPHWLVVHAIADHQFDLGLPAGIDHLAAFRARNRH